jgi:alpha-ribazole phosphatase/probable phosphoglycerate mutase
MSVLHFIRHGETDMAGRFCGQIDPDLNSHGREQANSLRLEGLEKVYSSDLRRSRSTAEALGVPVVVRPALREIAFGAWEGLRWEEIERADPEYAREWMARYPALPSPGGEGFQEFTRRVREEVRWLFEQPGTFAVVTHAGVLRLVLQHWLGCSEAEAWQRTQSYCCAFTLQGEKHEYCNQTW